MLEPILWVLWVRCLVGLGCSLFEGRFRMRCSKIVDRAPQMLVNAYLDTYRRTPPDWMFVSFFTFSEVRNCAAWYKCWTLLKDEGNAS